MSAGRPTCGYGYGYPIFNYYSPLTYYLANLIALVGLDIVTAVKAVFILGLLGAAAGMYVFVRANWGERAGVVAAAAYVFSPYLLFIDPHMRGDLAEFFALALFPWLLWAFQIRIRKSASNLQSPTSGTPTSDWRRAVGCAHPDPCPDGAHLQRRSSSPGYSGNSSANLPRNAIIRHSSFVIRHLMLALGLSAIYWLPFVLERNAVHLSVVGPGQFDFHNHFVAWRDLFAASPALDLGATAPKYIRNLGLAQWVLALLAIPAVLFVATA